MLGNAFSGLLNASYNSKIAKPESQFPHNLIREKRQAPTLSQKWLQLQNDQSVSSSDKRRTYEYQGLPRPVSSSLNQALESIAGSNHSSERDNP